MTKMKMFRMGFSVVLCAMAAQAGTLLLNPVTTVHQYQQTTNNPCVIGDSSCQNPATFPNYTLLPIASSYDALSPLYTVADIRGIVGNSILMGFDINQTSVVQTLSLFTMLINGSVVDTYTGAPTLVPPTSGGGNGNGYADYTFTGFTDLTPYKTTDTVQFHLVMPLVNDGREELFLISGNGGGGGQAVPEPVSFLLAGSGLIGIYFVRRRQAKSR
jgi:hypothetical protein